MGVKNINIHRYQIEKNLNAFKKLQKIIRSYFFKGLK